jgi:hypothetical protein
MFGIKNMFLVANHRYDYSSFTINIRICLALSINISYSIIIDRANMLYLHLSWQP